MKKRLLALLLTACLVFTVVLSEYTTAYAEGSTAQKTVKVLFVGNSFTKRNRLHKIFKGIAKADGVKVKAKRLAFGGYKLRKFASSKTKAGKKLRKLLKKDWDYVVLQGDVGILGQQPCNLEHHGHTAGAVVGGHHRLAMVVGVRVVVGPGAAIPMGADEDAVTQLWPIAGDDVVREQRRAVESLQRGALLSDGQSAALKLLHNPLSAAFVSLAVHGTRAEVALRLTEGIGRVGREHRPCRRNLLRRRYVLLRVGTLFGVVTRCA